MGSQPEKCVDNPIAGDLDHILMHTNSLWEELRGKCLFITGGTGFFGKWLLESFALANTVHNLNASALVLTRDDKAFKRKAPHLAANRAIRFHVGDVRSFDFPRGEFSHVIHAAATSAVATFNQEDPLVKFDTVSEGTRHVLDFAVQCGVEKVLLTSSGAIYGRQPASMTHVPEDYCGAPDPTDPISVWGESKRVAEFLCASYAKKHGFEAKIARCFSFVGPYLPLDIHYAVGNFIRDALNGGPIRVNGDGMTRRSYLYSADLTIWLWTILFRGRSCCPYNIGSEEDVTIAELAETVARSIQRPIEVRIAKLPDPNGFPQHYVPSTKRAQIELGIRQIVPLREAIARTIHHIRNLNLSAAKNLLQKSGECAGPAKSKKDYNLTGRFIAKTL